MEQTFRPLLEWQREIIPPKERTVKRFAEGVLEEGQELTLELLSFDGSEASKDKVADEARDVIIRAVGLIKELKPNIALDLFVQEKITDTVTNKYPPTEVKKHMKQGLTYDQAMKKCKQQYRKN